MLATVGNLIYQAGPRQGEPESTGVPDLPDRARDAPGIASDAGREVLSAPSWLASKARKAGDNNGDLPNRQRQGEPEPAGSPDLPTGQPQARS